MKKLIAPMVLLTLLISCCASAESLWTGKGTDSLFTDHRAKSVGDVVTIIISEQASSTQKASTDVSKKTSMSVDPGIGPILDKIPEMGFSEGDKVTSNGTTTRTTNVAARLTARVVEVEPNGNLVIEGTREVQTNKEKQTMKLHGVIRREDIAPDNTVLSSYIADAQITHEGTGPIGRRQKEGIITRVLRAIF